MPDERSRIVAAGYDLAARRYATWASHVEGDPRERMTVELDARLPEGARVLDLGCGSGLPSTRALAEHHDVVGVDASRIQIRLARTNVPKARFIEADIADVAFPDGSFDGVVAYYSISHVPRAEHAAIFERVARWLVPGGLFLASLGATDSPDWVGTWLGVPMFFSAFKADRNRALLQTAGFDLLIDEVVEIREPDGPATFLWVLAQTRVAAVRRSPAR
ncbi:MAG TPA: class I SAM-dependent methyltransferase [Candidatus Limnocylindrales bacterium]|nr:class I SAM-dependent methyltransferase [Candidatus Limnocylindrales bacterium]